MTDAFEEFLTREGIRFERPTESWGFRVHGNLDLSGDVAWELPDTLIVQVWMDVSGVPSLRMPRILFVQRNLHMDETSCALPKHLSVGGDISLSQATITTLPAGFQVARSLNLYCSQIASLPEGLAVGRSLDLRNTPLKRLPQELRVGHVVLPPSGLTDIVDFMEHETSEVVLSMHGSHHHRMATQARLQPFPDLWRVVCWMRGDYQLHIVPQNDGPFEILLKRTDM